MNNPKNKLQVIPADETRSEILAVRFTPREAKRIRQIVKTCENVTISDFIRYAVLKFEENSSPDGSAA